jgi:hypothetical protein
MMTVTKEAAMGTKARKPTVEKAAAVENASRAGGGH